jgi:hypothetical protein
MATAVTLGDLTRDPGEVARGLSAWQRGDPDDAAVLTLEASAREMSRGRFTLWSWSGRTTQGEPAWVLPVTSAQAATFAPKGPASALARSIAALLDGEVGADPDRLRLEEWRGHTCVVAPGVADVELASLAIEDANTTRAGGKARVAALPAEYALGGAPIPLAADPLARGRGLVALSRDVVLHPVLVLLALARHGFDPAAIPDDPSDLAESLRDLGYSADAPLPDQPPAPSFAIEDDACPRRRHARRVLRRLLQKGKIGGHHTEIDHFTRGLPDHEKRDAKEIVEALLRAGLLVEKPSVGQRHISLNRESLPEIHALIERGETADPLLAAMWTAPAPGQA